MFDRQQELALLKDLVEQLRDMAPHCPKNIGAKMLAMANDSEEAAAHLERLLIRQRVIRPKSV